MIYRMQEEKQNPSERPPSNFSIEHILNYAGSSSGNNDTDVQEPRESDSTNTFSWLHCTRFCPPKIPRNQKRDPPQKRQLGRYPRIPFTSHQISILEERFQRNPYLSSEEATILSQKLQLADVKVKIWFQNRRARKRREEMGQIKKEKKKVDISDSVNSAMSHPQDFVAGSHLVPCLYITPGCSILDANK